jgi:hypothetical protein
MYTFTMTGTQDDFDSYLPTFEKMLTSFKAPGVFTPLINIFIKATHSPQTGWAFTSQSTVGSRSNGNGAGFNSPTMLLKYGKLELDSLSSIFYRLANSCGTL